MDITGPSSSAAPRGRSRYFIACCLLLLIGATMHVWYLVSDCPLNLSGDEAHYWEWSRHLDLSYYSKGPLVAYIIAAGRLLFGDLSRRVLGNEELAVRLPAVLLSVLTGLGIYVLACQTLRSPRRALLALALTFTMPILAAGAMLMTIDAPLMFAWVWTWVCLAHAAETGRLWPWLVAGVLIAVGILAKYTMLLVFPALGLWLLTDPRLRDQLLRPGPYLCGLVGMLGFVPIVAWNANHGWVSFRHVAGQAGVANGPGINPLGPIEYLGSQLGVVNPVWFVLILAIAIIAIRRRGRAPEGVSDPSLYRLLLWATFTPFAVFLLFSPITKIQPNWPVTGLAGGSILLADWLVRSAFSAEPRLRMRARYLASAGVAIGLIAVILAHHTAWLMPAFKMLTRHAQPWELTPTARFDPTARLRGWSDLGSAVGEILTEEQRAGRKPFILTDDYQVASEIAFYCPGNPDVYCAQSVLGDRRSQYDIWPNPIRNPGDFVGRPCIYVGTRREALIGEKGALPGLRHVRTVEHTVRGEPVQVWGIFVCDRFAGFGTDAEPGGKY